MSLELNTSEPLVLAVTDGLGGHAAGEVASLHVTLGLMLQGSRCQDGPDIARLLERLDGELFERMKQDPRCEGMGATVAGFLAQGNTLMLFNVGDCRSYEIVEGYLRQHSVDDVPENTMDASDVAAGLSPSRSHMVTQSLGGSVTQKRLEPHVSMLPISRELRLLLCSDGLTDLVPSHSIESHLRLDDVAASEALVDSALEAGGHDNVSVLIARFTQSVAASDEEAS